MGTVCEHECQNGKYGSNCTKTCDCMNDSGCDKATGACQCRPGYSGLKCGIRNCPDGFFGPNCEHKCQCNLKNSLDCDSWDGTCKCKPVCLC